MDNKIKNYITNTLDKLAFLEEENVAYENIEIYDFQKTYEDGSEFRKQNGENYAMAVLNAITFESASKISREIKKNKNLTLKGLTQFVDSHRLKCFVEGSSTSYTTWKTGDSGVLVITYDDDKKQIIPSFTNETALDRS